VVEHYLDTSFGHFRWFSPESSTLIRPLILLIRIHFYCYLKHSGKIPTFETGLQVGCKFFCFVAFNALRVSPSLPLRLPDMRTEYLAPQFEADLRRSVLRSETVGLPPPHKTRLAVTHGPSFVRTTRLPAPSRPPVLIAAVECDLWMHRCHASCACGERRQFRPACRVSSRVTFCFQVQSVSRKPELQELR